MQLISKCILLNKFSLILTKPRKAFVPLFCIHWNQVFTSILISLHQVTQNLNLSLLDSEAHSVFPPLPLSKRTTFIYIFSQSDFCLWCLLLYILSVFAFMVSVLCLKNSFCTSSHKDIPIYFLLKNVSFAVHILCFYIFPQGKPTIPAPYAKYILSPLTGNASSLLSVIHQICLGVFLTFF